MQIHQAVRATIDYYNGHAQDWVVAHGGNEPATWWSKEMDRFHRFLPGGRVLEVGSGFGKAATALVALGFDYIGIDPSVGLLEIAKARNPAVDLRQMTVEQLDFGEASFDGFWAAASLLHLPKATISIGLQELHRVTRPAGIGFSSLKLGDGESLEASTGRLFSYYSRQEFGALLEAAGFRVVEDGFGPPTKDTWLVFFVERSA